MKPANKTTLIKFIFFPVYGIYVFLIVSLLNIFIIPSIFTSLLFLFDTEWTPILWVILLLPPIIISYYLKKTKLSLKTYVPIIQTTIIITIFVPLSEVLLAPMAMYVFEKEVIAVESISDMNGMQTILLDEFQTCLEIAFHPTTSRLQKNHIRNNMSETSLSKAATNALLQNDTDWLFFMPTKFSMNSFFSNKILYINQIDQTLYSKIGLDITKKLMSCNYQNETPEVPPEYSLLTSEEYQSIRRAEIVEDMKSLKKEVTKLEKHIKEYEVWLKTARGYYSQGGGPQLLTYIREAERDIALLKTYIEDYNKWIGDMETSAKGTVRESGVFLSPNTIHVELITTASSEYSEHIISTMLHEYLHYSSYNKGKTYPGFFNEGITEILNIDIKRQNSIYVQTHTYQGRVYILRRILEDVRYPVLITTYFNQDKEKLRILLDLTYGKDFYKNNEQYFSLIANLPDYESLDTINILLKNMGKDEVTFEEFTSYKGYNTSSIKAGKK